MRKLGAMPRMKVFLVTPLYLSLSCRYNVPSVVFLCLPALLAQPLWGAAAFCWQNVLQGVWCGRLFVAWTYSFLRCVVFPDVKTFESWQVKLQQGWKLWFHNNLTFTSVFALMQLALKQERKSSNCFPLPAVSVYLLICYLTSRCDQIQIG